MLAGAVCDQGKPSAKRRRRHMANSAAALRLQSDLKAISQSPPEGCMPFICISGSGASESFWATFGCWMAMHDLTCGLWCVNCRVPCAGAAPARLAMRTCLCGARRCLARTRASGRAGFSACGALQCPLAWCLTLPRRPCSPALVACCDDAAAVCGNIFTTGFQALLCEVLGNTLAPL